MNGSRKNVQRVGLSLLALLFFSAREGSPAFSAGEFPRGRRSLVRTALPGWIGGDVRSLLTAQTAVVEFHLGEKESRAFLLTKKRAWTAVLPSRDRIERSVNGFIRAVGRSPENFDPVRRAARRIATEILPFDRELANLGVTRLILIPKGILNRLAFEALRTDDGAGSAWLIEKYSISYAPSQAVIKESWTRKNTSGPRLLALGASCPGPERAGRQSRGDRGRLRSVRKEIREISRFFPGRCRCVYLDREANEENFRKHRGEKFQVVHIAAHGRRAGRTPARTALVLSLSPGDDGELHAAEIRGCGISAELVVLSACETADGLLLPQGGVRGLPGAFLREGARSVIGTLWPVPDRTTAEFMENLYGRLKSGLGKSGALREAKRTMIRGGRSHPFYWAGYVLFGDPDGKILFN